jgi:hypothetical protein
MAARSGLKTIVAVLALGALVQLPACTSDKSDDSGGPSTTTYAPYAGYTSDVYATPSSWLCRPDLESNPCIERLDATVLEATGETRIDPFVSSDRRPVDCFFLYGKVTNDEGPNSDLTPQQDEEIMTLRSWPAQLSRVCNVYAPIYRQSTTLSGPQDDDLSRVPAGPVAYASVLDAWKQYVANDNHGRGVVVVGQSAGASQLRRLVADEIDPDPVLRGRLVSALLIGWAVVVPPGEDVGGTFDNIPVCRSSEQTGCVVSYSSFLSSDPPGPTSRFGRPRVGSGESVCANPAALAGGSAELHPWFRTAGSTPSAPTLTTPGYADPSTVPRLTTEYVELPGLVRAECVHKNGYSYLEVDVAADAADPRVDTIPGDLGDEWGLHVADANLALGDLLTLIRVEASAFNDERG